MLRTLAISLRRTAPSPPLEERAGERRPFFAVPIAWIPDGWPRRFIGQLFGLRRYVGMTRIRAPGRETSVWQSKKRAPLPALSPLLRRGERGYNAHSREITDSYARI